MEDNKSMDIAKLAKLARLSFDPAQQQQLKKDLANLKALIDRVKNSDVAAQALPFEVLRPYDELKQAESEANNLGRGADEPKPSLPLEVTEKLAPKFAMGHFIIPKVLPK